MSTAQPPHHEEDSLQAPHADSQQADLIRSRDRVSGEKKAWAKKARRRHSVTTAKFTSHDTGKADTTSVTQTLEVETHDVQLDLLADKQTEEVLDALTSEEAAADNTTPEEEIVEELEVVEEQPEEDSNEEADQELVDRGEEPESDTAEEDVEDLGEYVDELSQELDAIEGSEVVEEEPENEPPAEPLLVDDSPENEQAGEIVEELEIKRERISHRQADLQARSWDAPFKHEAPTRQKPTKRVKPTPVSAPAPAPEPVERPRPTKREKPKPALEPKSAPTSAPAAAARPKPTKRKKPAPRYRYIKSLSLEQAFRNLLRLDAGEAWRATRIPLVAFFLCFALLALAVVDQAPAIDSFNATINALVQGARGALDSFFVTITMLGDLLPMTALCLVICAILAIARKWDSLAFFATNVILAVVCVQALKFIFAVPRPGAETLVPIPGSFSFPSAHSFCSLIVFGMIGLLIFRALNRKGVSYNVAIVPGIILVIFAILIGISRIYVGVHWPSDVLGGWLLAGMWLPFASALYGWRAQSGVIKSGRRAARTITSEVVSPEYISGVSRQKQNRCLCTRCERPCYARRAN